VTWMPIPLSMPPGRMNIWRIMLWFLLLWQLHCMTFVICSPLITNVILTQPVYWPVHRRERLCAASRSESISYL